MLLFILKSSACLLLFLGFYKLVLEQENMHVFKRFYLLGAIATAILIPLITFTTYVEVAPLTPNIQEGVSLNTTIETSLLDDLNWSLILWSIYLIGAAVFGFRFINNLYHLEKKIRHNPKRKDQRFISVLLEDLIIPHTFFNYIFFNKQKFEAREIPKEVFWHEQTHAIQKHSIDVLLIESLRVIFWFNPLFYIYRHLIKLNHEFLADQGVLNKGIETKTYQETILAFSSNASQPILANALNYSLIKKRFTVMKTRTSKKAIWLRSVILLPLLAIMLYSFSSREIIEKEREITDSMLLNDVPLINQEIIQQEGATKAQIKEYNSLAKKLNYTADNNDEYVVRKKDVERLKYLYGLMTDSQKNKAEPFPNIAPPPPPAPDPPKIRVKELPPPPPPIPADATPAQKEKYKEAIKSYKRAVEKAAKANGELIRVREINDAEKAKLKQVKEQYTKQRKANTELRKAEMAQYKEQLAKQRKLQAKERELLREQYKVQRMNENEAKIIQEKLKQVEKRQAIAEEKRVIALEKRVKQAEKRQVRTAEKRSAAIADRVKRQEQRIAKREIGEVPPPPPPPKSPIDHVVDMAKKGAVFYVDNKKVSSDKAIDFIKNNKNINISTKESSSKKPKVYISKND